MIVGLFLSLIALAMATYVIFCDVREERARAEVEAQRAYELSTALDRVLQENDELRQSNTVLQESNARLQEANYERGQEMNVPAGELEHQNPRGPAENISPIDGAVLDNGRSDRTDYIEWVFDWPDVPGAVRYNLYVIGGRAQFPAINVETEESAYVHLALGSYIADSNRTGWTWKVRSLVDDVWSEWSDERSFEVEMVDSDQPASGEQEN